jgi:hypothetical protein
MSGASVTYGGGGAGGSIIAGGTGGAGGGANGGYGAGGGGAANTGGGGGGGGPDNVGGAGGSGIVIVRYVTGTAQGSGGTITTGGGYTIHTFTSSGTFTLTIPAPTLTAVSPNSGNQGATVGVMLTGTNFVSGGTTVAVSGAGVTVSGTSVASATSLTASFAIGGTAASGARNVTVATTGGTTAAQTFTINVPPPPPSPSSGYLAKYDNTAALLASSIFEGSNGNLGVGTSSPATKLHIVGDVRVDGNISAKYQDVAEWVDAGAALPAGTVVVVDATKNRAVACSVAYDTAVIGVVSAAPGIVLGEDGPGRVLVAQSGRVRTKVDASYGAIKRGDLLVTSTTSGYAMRSAPLTIDGVSFHRPGTIVGKALEDLAAGTGEILVLITVQ